MKISTITPESLKNVSNRELTSMHRRIHQLFGVTKTRMKTTESRALMSKLLTAHTLIVEEMEQRGMRHKTPLVT